MKLKKLLKRHLAVQAMKGHRQASIATDHPAQVKEPTLPQPALRPSIARRRPPKMVSSEVTVNIEPTAPTVSAPITAIVPAPPASPIIAAAPASVKHEKDAKEVRPLNGKPSIYLDIERGNRMMIKWPSPEVEGLDRMLAYDEENEGNTIIGPIEDLTAQRAKKKTSPLNYLNAWKMLTILKAINKLTNWRGDKLYDIHISDAFESWFSVEREADKLATDAHKLLTYDEATVQTSFPFLKLTLFPWQTPAFQFLNAVTRQGRGAFLCDETGLGKTITIAAHLKSMGYKAIICCPAGLRSGWKKKIESACDLTCIIVDSKYPLNASKYDVIIVSYAMLKKRGVWPLTEIIDTQNRVLILDEGHAVKNYDSVRTAISLTLSRYAKHSIVVTATPLKNRVAELHPLLRITRRLWTEMGFEAFVKAHSTEDGQERVAEHLQKFMVRRMADEVWKDAPKVEVGEAWLDLTNRADYHEAEQDFIQWLARHGADTDRLEAAERGHALVKLNKLRELAAVGKVEAACRIIEETMSHGEQVVIFCAFNEPLFEIARRFQNRTGTNFKGQKWRGAACIVGSVLEKKRNVHIDAFMRGEIGLLCVGTMAGGLGIDLPIAAYGYFLDLPWTPADFEQCTGRLKRIGQERDCQFFKLLASDTIDQRMEAIIQEKAHTFRRAIGDKGIVDRVTGRDASTMRETIVSSLIRSYLRDAG